MCQRTAIRESGPTALYKNESLPCSYGHTGGGLVLTPNPIDRYIIIAVWRHTTVRFTPMGAASMPLEKKKAEDACLFRVTPIDYMCIYLFIFMYLYINIHIYIYIYIYIYI